MQVEVRCYDCHCSTTDWVMEIRQVSGGDGVVYSGDFQERLVHANRRECQQFKKQREEEMRHSRDPFYDFWKECDWLEVKNAW